MKSKTRTQCNIYDFYWFKQIQNVNLCISIQRLISKRNRFKDSEFTCWIKIELYNEALSHTKIMQLILNKNYQKSYQSNRELLL